MRVEPFEGGSKAETKDAASSGLSRTLSGASSSSITGRRRSIAGPAVLEPERKCPTPDGSVAITVDRVVS